MTIDRRSFLTATAAASVPGLFARRGYGQEGVAARTQPARQADAPPTRPVAISSGNGIPAVTRAVEAMRANVAPVAAVVEGVTIVEDDPKDMSVGYGGLPNEAGVVQLDASVMDGPSHKAGAVAALERIRNPAKVALEVLRRTDHVLLVGDGALAFARALGFEEENLLTKEAREVWLRWKRNLNPADDWLDYEQDVERDAGAGAGRQSGAGRGRERASEGRAALARMAGLEDHYGTIHCSAVNDAGELGACTTTSGLSFKIPGRVGDSPIIGAGMFVDNAVGSAGATGRGEAVIQSCGAFQVVRHMAEGLAPTEACLKVLKWIADHTHRRMLLNERGEPNFNVVLYALRKDGAYGSACMRKGRQFAVHAGGEARKEECAWLFE